MKLFMFTFQSVWILSKPLITHAQPLKKWRKGDVVPDTTPRKTADKKSYDAENSYE